MDLHGLKPSVLKYKSSKKNVNSFMRLIVILSFVICHFTSFSQKVTLTPLSFNKDFTLEKVNVTDVLKDYNKL